MKTEISENEMYGFRVIDITDPKHRIIFCDCHLEKSYAELIVKAVNMHDTLIEENQKLKADNEALRLAAHFISDDDVEAKLRNQVYQLQAEKAELIEKALEAFTPMFKVIPKQQNLILIVEALRDAYNKIESLKDKSLSREDYTKEHFTGE